jgi:hypothetical protein
MYSDLTTRALVDIHGDCLREFPMNVGVGLGYLFGAAPAPFSAPVVDSGSMH